MRIRRFTKWLALGTVRQVTRALVYGAFGVFIALVVVAVMVLNSRPDLKVWHTAELDEEFTTRSEVKNFTDYLALEERLFKQLNDEVYTKLEPEDRRQLNRYHRGSLADPGNWPSNWNRSFELPANTPHIGVLLIHGLSDSPYSLRHLGQRLQSEGAWVLGMRVPGHGTAPVGLVETQWQDMAAAVTIAVRHLHNRIGERPLFIVGYSNGGALAVQYALKTLLDHELPRPRGLVLLSPEIGITRLAALAVWQERLGHVLGMQKLAWNSILPEYDPFKYGSFALNAGKQAYLLTEEIQAKITRVTDAGVIEQMPPILAFQSVVDATVTAPALVEGLFDRLPPGQHELVLFDINRFTEVEPILNSNPTAWIDSLLRGRQLDYSITLITNENGDSKNTVARKRNVKEHVSVECGLDLSWPEGVYSLSHVALPFSPDDPVYGEEEVPGYKGIRLGDVSIRGERGVLQISEGDLMRLRWNPFYTYQEKRILDFLDLVEIRNQDCHILSS